MLQNMVGYFFFVVLRSSIDCMSFILLYTTIIILMHIVNAFSRVNAVAVIQLALHLVV